MTYNPGPQAPYNNLPIHPEDYQPRKFFILTIALGQTTTVTTTVDHDYVIGQSCRLWIPQMNGCRQLNGSQGVVVTIPSSTQVVLTIDSLINVDPFISTILPLQPQIVAIGDFNSGAINQNGRIQNLTYIPGSFINISS